jgi:hypothetical protein
LNQDMSQLHAVTFVGQAVSSKKFVVKISISVDTLKNKHKLIEHTFILFISENQEIFL